MVKREILSLHVGQAGIQTANAMWELYCLEHSVGPDGFVVAADGLGDNDNSYETFFEVTDKNRFVPRAIFFDTESLLIDEIISGAYGQLYHPCQLIKGVEDGANNFARGSFNISKRHMFALLERIRRNMEICENCEGFMISHSLGGGTGSGFSSILLHALQAEFAKFNRIQIPVFPGQIMSTAIVEPYNSVLHIHATIDSVDLSLLFGNEALYDICANLLNAQSPTYTTINRVLALVTSSSTASLRFKGQLNSDLGEMQTNLVPYPRIHYPLLRYSPILHTLKTKHTKPTVASITKEVFSKKFQTIKTDDNRGRYIAVILNYRGLISQRDINQTIHKMKMKQELDFVEWCPTGFKIGINNSIQSVVPESEISLQECSVSMIANTTSIKDAWWRLGRKFVSLFQRRAFVHWYVGEGMEESEFEDAYDNMLMLIEDYNECAMSEDEIQKVFGDAGNPNLDIDEDEDEDEEEDVKETTTPVKPLVIPIDEPLSPRIDTNSRLMVRRHSSRASIVQTPLGKAGRRVKRQQSKNKKLKKGKTVERRIIANKSTNQMLNTAILHANNPSNI